MAKRVNVQLPKALLGFTPRQREDVLERLREALDVPAEMVLPRSANDEHNIWERNFDELVAEAEDALYIEMVTAEADSLADLLDALGLPLLSDDEVRKSFSEAYEAWEDETFLKAKGKRPKIADLLNASRKKRDAFLKWIEGKVITPSEVKKVDNVLRQKLPKYAKRAEAFMTRGAFLGKIRNQAEREHLETFGAYIDRFPETIVASTHTEVVLNLRQQQRAEDRGQKVKILPLTQREKTSVIHATHSAGDKLTEVSARHRTAIRQIVIRASKERWSTQRLAQALYDKFGEHNRDWRRVAITELAFVVNDAYLSGLEEGDRVIGMGSVSACKHCKMFVINKEFTVTHKPPKTDTYEGDMKFVWSGKSNYGRRVQEYRACIPLHPNCRCRWHRLSNFYKVAEDTGKLKRKTTAELIQEERAKRGLAPDPNIEAQLAQIRKML